MHQGDGCAVLRHLDVGAHRLVIWTGNLREIVQTKVITPDADRVADVHLHVFLILVARHEGNSAAFACFQRAIGPTPIRNIAGAISGTNTVLKYGGPTESLPRFSASTNSG